jgi:hypothetical protein
MLDFRVTVADKFAQKSIDIYRGFVQVYANINSSDTSSKSSSLQREQSQSNVLLHQQSTVPRNAAAVAEEAGKPNTLIKVGRRYIREIS